MARREHGDGSIYQRSSDGRWIGTLDIGWTDRGTRDRRSVTGKTRAEVVRKLRDLRRKKDSGELGAAGRKPTVKAWADQWLDIKVTTLKPKAYNAAASPIRKWIIPTIGHRRLEVLTPGDIRAVATAQRKAGRKGTTAAATQRVLLNMLRDAVAEGHAVPPRVLLTKAPATAASDRTAPTLGEAVRMLEVASTLPHGTRWLFALLHGARKGECLGLTWDAVHLDKGYAVLEWQLQALPYNVKGDKASGFRVPEDFEAVHLVDSWHLIRLKTKKGYRIAPLTAAEVEALAAWKQVAPPNPWGLVWPTAAGRPANDKHDLAEWHALQGTAGVGHPAGRYYHVHETRNYASTELEEVGASDFATTSLLGHTTARTSAIYKAERIDSLRRVVAEIEARLMPSDGA